MSWFTGQDGESPATPNTVRALLPVWPCLFAFAVGAPGDRSNPTTPSQKPTSGGVRAFAPGVRIDWSRRRVELDAQVVLRRGPLELLACSPQTREHESIFVVKARPQRVYQAMGLIGLEPGSPVRYDETHDRWYEPNGVALDILVRCGAGTAQPVRRLLRRTGEQKELSDIQWVFSGSRRSPDGRFGADLDGTLICVVDFETALISVGARHTADNDQLWLEANTEAIPPVGTACTLLIAAHEGSADELRVLVEPGGALTVETGSISVVGLVKRVKESRRDRDRFTVRLEPDAGVDGTALDELAARLVKAGIPQSAIVIDETPPAKKPQKNPKRPTPNPK